jgi:hypothetical protein
MPTASRPPRRRAIIVLVVEGLLAVVALAIDFLINVAASDVSIPLRRALLLLVPLVLLGGGLALVLRGFAIADSRAQPATLALTTVPARDLDLSDIRFKLGPNPSAAYFERDAFRQACELLGKVVAGTASGRLGLLVVGVSMVGKSRLALEGLRCAAPDVELLIWPHLWPELNTVALLDALDRFRGKPLAVLLDDLAEYASGREAAFVLTAMDKLRRIARPLVIVATSRTGGELAGVERDFGSLVDRLFPVTLTPMERQGDEARAFLRQMEVAGVELHRQSFDGTPGSALLDLDRRTALLRDPAFPRGALAVLQALALLRGALVYTYPESV